MKIKNITYILVALTIVSCKPKFDDVVVEAGSADFTRYVAIGNSLTAGYADGTLYKSGQENSYPNMLAEQMKKVNSSLVFKQPLMPDDLGGFSFDPVGFPVKRILGYSTDCTGSTGLGPILASGSPNSSNISNIGGSGPYQNMGVPGARVGHLLFSGLGDPAGLTSNPATANPWFVRFASIPSATIIEDAMKSDPTFFTLWIGNNDVLLHAVGGADDPNQPLTPLSAFSVQYSAAVDALTKNGAKGALANIPDITSIPFFTTVPWNALNVDVYTAENLTTIFSNVADAANKIYGGGLGEQYRIKFNTGNNGFLVKTPVSASDPLGFRQLKEGEYILLTVNQNALKCQGYGSFNSTRFGGNPDSLLVAINPLDGKDVLDASEVSIIRSRTQEFNAHIKNVAASKSLAFVDMASYLASIKNNGFMYDGVNYTTQFVLGGSFSLDGVHLTPRGYAVTANYFISDINAHYGAKLPQVNVNDYPGTTMP